MNAKHIRFTNRGGQKLAARIDLPIDGKPGTYAIFAHCFTCTKNLKAVHNINRALTRNGVAVMRFDFTGLGESEGDFADTNFTTNVSDLVDAAGYLEAEFAAPQILIGHSLGGAAVLQAAGQIASAKAVVVLGAPANADHVLTHITGARDDIETEGEAEVQLAGRPFRIKKQFIDDLESRQMTGTISRLRRALLILHSPIDNTVGIDHAAQIFKAAKHPKSFISLDRADHLISDAADSQYAGTMIAAWAQKYIQIEEKTDRDDAAEDHRIVASNAEAGYTTEILAGGHHLVADEPVSAGGNGMGPNPYDYLAASLGACTAITLRMYADRKQWPVETIRVNLAHKKIHADQCRDCETKKGYLDVIERNISLTGDIDSDQRERMVQIADRCPVHRSLTGEIKIDTKLEEK